MRQLDGQTALVTGASQGIGRAIARMLAAQGARVGLFARNREKLESLAAEISAEGGEALVLAGSVCEQGDVDAALKRLLEAWGRIDILVNNAGITRDGLLLRMKDDAWQSVLDVNLSGAFRLIRAAARTMLRQRAGRIVNVVSVSGLLGQAGQANYSASKAGLVGLTKACARELAPRGITVNAVAPGPIVSEMTEALNDKQKEALQTQVPLGRFGRPEEVAAAVCYLASPLAAYVSGTVIRVDGGMAM